MPRGTTKRRAVFEEIAMLGDYTGLLQARVPKNFLLHLQEYAKNQKTSTPSITREILSFSLYPFLLERYIDDIHSIAYLSEHSFTNASRKYRERLVKFINEDADKCIKLIEAHKAESYRLLSKIRDLEQEFFLRLGYIRNKNRK